MGTSIIWLDKKYYNGKETKEMLDYTIEIGYKRRFGCICIYGFYTTFHNYNKYYSDCIYDRL